MLPESTRFHRKVISESQALIDAASKQGAFGVHVELNRMFGDGRHNNQQIAMTAARAIAKLENRCSFFEVTLVEAMGNYVDYLLTLGPEKVSSEHIGGALGLMNAVEELMKKYSEGS
jgi:hypothetical protein